MRNVVASLSSTQDDHLFLLAEARARAGEPQNPADHADARASPTDFDLLAEVAAIELARLSARAEVFTAGLNRDTTWFGLLDLFIATRNDEPLPIATCAARWNTSVPTANRIIAALIESRLVVRVFGPEGKFPNNLHVTPRAATMLRYVFVK